MKPPKPPKFVTLAIMTTITLVFWVFLSVYKILTGQIEPSVSEEILASVSPSLDSEALTNVRESLYFEENQISSIPTSVVETIEPEIEDNVVAEDEVEPIQTLTPTPIVESSEPLNTSTNSSEDENLEF